MTKLANPSQTRNIRRHISTTRPICTFHVDVCRSPPFPLTTSNLHSPMVATTPKLFTPIKVGNMTLQHRVVMAPMTRMRADKNHVPTPLMTEYYAQRASTPGTFIITEGTIVAAKAGGYAHAPNLETDEQVAAWKHVGCSTILFHLVVVSRLIGGYRSPRRSMPKARSYSHRLQRWDGPLCWACCKRKGRLTTCPAPTYS